MTGDRTSWVTTEDLAGVALADIGTELSTGRDVEVRRAVLESFCEVVTPDFAMKSQLIEAMVTGLLERRADFQNLDFVTAQKDNPDAEAIRALGAAFRLGQEVRGDDFMMGRRVAMILNADASSDWFAGEGLTVHMAGFISKLVDEFKPGHAYIDALQKRLPDNQ